MVGAQDAFEFNLDQGDLKCIFIYLFDFLFNPLWTVLFYSFATSRRPYFCLVFDLWHL
jgi:hypothetical protein